MRPILLKIKGLNSFIEEQTIDFARLMEPGLFGIFGPTGSGKTTILDGITLALYGEIARKSSNFVNTNCKSANVLFEFQISGAETKRYRVEREFKKDPNRDGYKTGKCRISDITGQEPVILADKVKEVNDYCIEIIGLKADDFQRTVVLPQGRFSEFLKLEGKKRSEMLERLFRLQPYGDGLTRKLKAKSDEIAHQRSNLEGQLQSYVDISKE
ncbi:MAG: SMC family ATPase, partial [Clostridium sp.]|nr:SMC family ATPase [Clostridium sp.]